MSTGVGLVSARRNEGATATAMEAVCEEGATLADIRAAYPPPTIMTPSAEASAELLALADAVPPEPLDEAETLVCEDVWTFTVWRTATLRVGAHCRAGGRVEGFAMRVVRTARLDFATGLEAFRTTARALRGARGLLT